jgi:hypothetical protein
VLVLALILARQAALQVLEAVAAVAVKEEEEEEVCLD